MIWNLATAVLSLILCHPVLGGPLADPNLKIDLLSSFDDQLNPQSNSTGLPSLPAGYERCDNVGSFVFNYHTENLSWSKARDHCISEGGYLALIDSIEKMNCLKIIPDLATGTTLVYTGLHLPEGTTKWVYAKNGHTFTSLPWGDDEPDSDESMRCAVIYKGTGSPELANFSCEVGHSFVCEISA